MNKTLTKYISVVAMCNLMAITACEDLLKVEPPTTQIVGSEVFKDEATAIAAINGIYSEMMANTSGFASGGTNSVSIITGLSSDEFTNSSSVQERIAFSTNGIVSNNSIVKSALWQEPYKFIHYANGIIEGLMSNSSIPADTRSQLIGEAKFIRAFCYFHLVNLFGDVPLITSTDYRINSVSSRSSASSIYEFIVSDLTEAENLMIPDWSHTNDERIRPNKWAATALLARVYLYTGQWSDAITKATLLINNDGQFSLSEDLNEVFLKNSSEAIWQLKPVLPGVNTLEGNILILTFQPSNQSVSNWLLDSFESNDKRRNDWINSVTVSQGTFYFPYKYKVKTGGLLTEYTTVFRLAEQYLIRAEAKMHEGSMNEAINDIDVVRERAGLPKLNEVYPQLDANTLPEIILHERQVELFTEWGHRWFDLKRTGNVVSILSSIKADFTDSDALYPIPQSEILNNPNLQPQNDGY